MGRYRFRKGGTSPRTSTGRCTSSITTRGKLRGSILEIGTYVKEEATATPLPPPPPPPLPPPSILLQSRHFNRLLLSRNIRGARECPAKIRVHVAASVYVWSSVAMMRWPLPLPSPSPLPIRCVPPSLALRARAAISRGYAIQRAIRRECVFLYDGVYCKSCAFSANSTDK